VENGDFALKRALAQRDSAQNGRLPHNRFFSLDPVGRRQYSEDTAANVYYEQVATHWGNWAKVFFNNKGVVAKATDVCTKYPRGNMSVWDWR